MSMFENGRYHWRETYFVLFRRGERPKLKKLELMLRRLSESHQLKNLHADEDGFVESLTLLAPDDFAAVDICYVEGEEVREQIDDLLRELKPELTGAEGKAILERIARCDARLDVLHFEEKCAADEDDDEDEALDPTTLLLVLGKLAKLTGGIAFDPQSGVIVEEE